MTVAELIEELRKLPQDLQVVVPLFSEQHILERGHVGLMFACPARPDGWVQNYRKDAERVQYLCIG